MVLFRFDDTIVFLMSWMMTWFIGFISTLILMFIYTCLGCDDMMLDVS